MTVDYRQLLVKYIQHVGECEGTDFITHIDGWRPTDAVRFSDDEKAALREAADAYDPDET